MKINETLESLGLDDITLLDPYEANAFELEKRYLLSLDEERLLRGFCDIAGIKSDAPLYGGWETSDIQGHTLGHYLTALSQAYKSSGEKIFRQKIDRIVDVLSECQEKNGGYLAAIPEEHYIKLERGEPEGTWVPWYSMHKILSGLLSAYKFTGRQKALDVAARLGDWVFTRVLPWDAETQKTVLSIEYGGMNDCLYELYSLTLKKDHLVAAHCFDELPLFTALYQKHDILDGKHANTTIPKILGGLRRYLVLGEGEEFYLEAAINFWDIVTEGHTYITGGNSEWEHFGAPKVLDAERTECNCETCNTYNMLKLTRELFRITRDKKYADYYERAFINAILSSQNPKTGMTTYFQPMATGFFKVYSSPENHFWCCTGSGMESFSKLGDSIYFKDRESLFVLRYSDSKVIFSEKGLTVTQKTELPKVFFTVEGTASASLMLRIPHWCKESPAVKLNKESITPEKENGFIKIEREWKNGDTVELYLPMNVIAHSLPDNENALAFTYGPWLLSAELGKSKMETGVTGVNVTVPLADEDISGDIRVRTESVSDWLRHLEGNLVKDENSLTFRIKNTDRELIFTPHYRQHESRYGIYFRFRA